ncbi:unnamed protein product [Adineta ricciae]|uniref:Uncharacterized protein n=1 Tax=Adineta ricciae TaxID=249248 RepID=A0A815J6Q7_ADIRI|nr:unnamed protein product [Adineta ricciae]CAF1378315.1 unnamed protein product [Adineta ricciae]
MMIFVLLGVVAVLIFLVKIFDTTDIPKIHGLPEAPNWPVFGSLFQLGENHSKSLSKLAKKLGPVFQIRMGNRRIVVANSYDSIKYFWVKNQAALISRPALHTFHNVVSSEVLSIGTSPWDESCKQRRKAAATALNKPAVQTYMPIIDHESYIAINEILHECQDGKADINIIPHLQRFALNTSLTLNYGTRIASSDDALLKEIVTVEGAVAQLRSASNNWQDYVPLLRIFPARSNEAATIRQRRDRYLVRLLNGLKKDIANGVDKPCITGNILKDPSAKLNETEIRSICLTMISAALETVPANIILGIGYLSSPHGQEIQERAYREILDVYPNGDAWDRCLDEEQVPYVTALYKEILRYYTVHHMSLPRRSVQEIEYEGSRIPAGTSFYMNAFAGDYDENHFEDPYQFNPDRYLGDVDGTPHYAYGAGTRMCIGAHLANRELYTFLVRLIIGFRILGPLNKEDAAILDGMEINARPTGLVVQPKMFKCRFEPRNLEDLKRWIDGSKQRAEHH